RKVQKERSLNEIGNVSARERVEHIVEGLIIIFDRMYAMDPKFCLENLLYLDTWLSLEIVFDEKNYPMKILSQLLVQCTDIDVSKITKIQLHALTRHLQLLTWSMLKDNPDYSRDEEFKRVLVNSALSFIDKAV